MSIQLAALWLTAFAVSAQSSTWKGHIFGRVVDAAGKSVSGAAVEVMRSRYERLPEMLEQNVLEHAFVYATGRTDKVGKFAIEVDASGLYGVRAATQAPALSRTQHPVPPGQAVVRCGPSALVRPRAPPRRA